MRSSLLVKLIALLAGSSVSATCGNSPPATVTLHGGACTGTIGCNVATNIESFEKLGPVMTIKACVTCNGAPLRGVGGIIGTIRSKVPVPPNVPITIFFDPTGTDGCTTVRYVLPGSVLRGQQVKVDVVDTSDDRVTSTTVTIK